MSKLPKIDITKAVMSQIESGEVKMRSKTYFTVKKAAKIFGLIVIGLLVLSAVFYAVVIVQNGVFKEYLEFGKQGASLYWSSIPWGAIVVAILLTAVLSLGIYLLQQKKRLVPTFAVTFAGAALVAVVVFKIGPDPVNSSFAKAVLQYNNNPTKIAGTVQEKNGDEIKVKTSDGVLVTIKINSTTLGGTNFETGDDVLVLGYKQNSSINADAIKVTKKNEKQAKEVKQQDPVKTEPEVKLEEPKPEQKPTAAAPVVKPPSSAPTPPPAPTDYISLGSAIGLPAGGPFTKYQVTWSANFSANFKLVWGTSPDPTWPTSHYSYSGVFGNSDSGKVRKDMGAGTYYVRACRYNSLTSVCDLYSNQITVVFP